MRFVRDGAGFLIEGRLVDSAVDAPPSLHALAEIERGRPGTALFPIRLDAAGRIVTGRIVTGPPAPPAHALQEASALVSRAIGEIDLPHPGGARAQDFVRQVQGGGARSPWPAELFRPFPGRRSQTHAVPLPDGGTGHVTIEIQASAREPGGLLSSYARTVVTETGGGQRVTREEWTLDGSEKSER